MQNRTKITVGIGIIVLVILPVAWYTLSPLWRNVELQDVSPLSGNPQATPPGPIIKDELNNLDEKTKAERERQMAITKGNIIKQEDAMPGEARLISQGTFVPRAHDVAGKALLIRKDNELTLRFEDFETINGPEVHIYLSSEFGTADFIDLGKIRGTRGNINYTIPAGTDTNKYNKVLVWCKPFSVLFSYAELK